MPQASGVFILIINIVLCGQLYGQEQTITINPFDLSGVSEYSEDYGVLLTELVTVELARSDNLIVLARQQIEDLLQQDTLKLSGFASSKYTVTTNDPNWKPGVDFWVSGKAFSLAGKLTVTVNLTDQKTGFVKTIFHQSPVQKRLSVLAYDLSQQIRNAVLASAKAIQISPYLDSHTSPSVQRSTNLPRVSILIHEIHLGIAPSESLVQKQLTSLLLERGFEVIPSNEALVAWHQSTMDSQKAPPPLQLIDPMQSVNVLILGQATTKLGLRTGSLVSSHAQLDLTLYQVQSPKLTQTFLVDSNAFDVSPDAATREALRHAAKDSLEAVLSSLLGEAP